jgi:hypothetical protein
MRREQSRIAEKEELLLGKPGYKITVHIEGE